MGLVGGIPEGKLTCEGLRAVVELRARAVRIDIERVCGFVVAGLPESIDDAPRLGDPVRTRGRGMVGVAGVAVAHHLPVYPRASREGMLQLLQHQHCGTVPHDEALAVGAERQGGVFRILRAAESLCVRETGYA